MKNYAHLVSKKEEIQKKLSNDLDMHFCFRTNYIDFFYGNTHFFIKSEHYGLVMMCNVILLSTLYFPMLVVVQKTFREQKIQKYNGFFIYRSKTIHLL